MEQTWPDAVGNVRGRGAGLNPANRFDGLRLHVLGDELDRQHADNPHGSQCTTAVFADRSRSIINPVESPDLSFSWTLNPYRGCEHGCTYCYARPTHESLGWSCGLDFETKIVAKHDAPLLLRKELAQRRWRGEPIVMSGVTDPYQPIERSLQITRACLKVMNESNQPVSVITKNRLITRDIDLLGPMAARRCATALISITTLDAELARSMEPRASSPAGRLEAIRQLADAGVPVTVMVAPVIAGLNDHDIPAILKAAADAGATNACWVMLRLPRQVRDVFFDWVDRTRPAARGRIERSFAEIHEGNDHGVRWGARMRGTGCRADGIARTFGIFAARCGLDVRPPDLDSGLFRRPSPTGQMRLFDG